MAHDRDALRELPHHAQIVGDEQVRHAVFFLQPPQQLDDLRLYGHIQGADSLVADNELRLQ